MIIPDQPPPDKPGEKTNSRIAIALAAGNMLEIARAFTRGGVSVFPVKSNGSKEPAIDGWRDYSERVATDAYLVRWYRRAQCGIGITGGKASGWLVILDFETRAAFDRWAASLDPAERIALARCPVVFTPGGGVHIYVRLTEAVKGAKYARDTAGKCLFEVRGCQHYVVAPGSPGACHPTGRPYRLVRVGWLDGQPFEPMDLNTYYALILKAAELNEYTKPAPKEVVGDRRTSSTNIPVGTRPGDIFNARVTWGDILGPAGWRVFRSGGSATYWTRPGKPAGVSASTGFCKGPSGHDLLYVFSSSAAPFEAERSYSRFGAYALIHHGGDWAAATRALAAAGYAALRRIGRRAGV